jgi:hypothetical protein
MSINHAALHAIPTLVLVKTLRRPRPTPLPRSLEALLTVIIAELSRRAESAASSLGLTLS